MLSHGLDLVSLPRCSPTSMLFSRTTHVSCQQQQRLSRYTRLVLSMTSWIEVAMDSTSTFEPEWAADIDELTAAVKQEIEICSKRYFYENIRGFRFVPKVLPPGVDCLWVKYKDEGPTLEAEACTQEYVYGELSKWDEPARKGLHVPKVFDYAEIRIDDFTYSFIIMEFVTGTPISHITSAIEVSGDIDSLAKEDRIHLFEDRVVDALCFLLSLEPPSDAGPGPVGGGRIQSFVFGRENSYAPRAFDTLGDLEAWVNEENEKVRQKYRESCMPAW